MGDKVLICPLFRIKSSHPIPKKITPEQWEVTHARQRAWHVWVYLVQSLTILYTHGLMGDEKFSRDWFNRVPDAVLMDQRLLWIFPLIVLVIKGAVALSIDRALMR